MLYDLPAYTNEIPDQISATKTTFLVQELFTYIPIKPFLGVYYHLYIVSGLFVFQILTFQISGFVTWRIFLSLRLKKKKTAEKEEKSYS